MINTSEPKHMYSISQIENFDFQIIAVSNHTYNAKCTNGKSTVIVNADSCK